MASDAELKFQRANTSAFIAANAKSIVLTPRSKVKSGSGTQYVNGTPRVAQTFRLIDQSSTISPTPGHVLTPDGTEVRIEGMLLGVHDAEIALHDIWTDADGGQWEVVKLFPSNGYETRAGVARHA